MKYKTRPKSEVSRMSLVLGILLIIYASYVLISIVMLEWLPAKVVTTTLKTDWSTGVVYYLVMGFCAPEAEVFRPLAEELPGQVILVDCRGNWGGAERVAYAMLADMLTRKRGVKTYRVLGFSMGMKTAVKLYDMLRERQISELPPVEFFPVTPCWTPENLRLPVLKSLRRRTNMGLILMYLSGWLVAQAKLITVNGRRFSVMQVRSQAWALAYERYQIPGQKVVVDDSGEVRLWMAPPIVAMNDEYLDAEQIATTWNGEMVKVDGARHCYSADVYPWWHARKQDELPTIELTLKLEEYLECLRVAQALRPPTRG